MQKAGKRTGIEERVTRRARRNQIRDVILLSAYVAIGTSMMIMTPNAMRLLKQVEKVVGPSPRLKRRVSQKYSELIAQGIFKRTHSSNGSRVELTDKGIDLAEELALKDELRPERQRKWDYKWRIIMFDIPEKFKKGRDALAKKMKDMEIYPMQKSVYVCPFHCKDEIDFVSEVFGVRKFVHYVIAGDLGESEELKLKMFYKLE